MVRVVACLFLIVFGQTVFAQGSKILVSVKIDSIYETYYLRNLISDSFTCIFQNDKLLFYEKSYRVGQIDLATQEIIGVLHMPPVKILVEKNKLIGHGTFDNKMISAETMRSSNPRLLFQLFGKLNFNQFFLTGETKTISGVVSSKLSGLGPDGDTTIIWIRKDSTSNHLKSIFNYFFLKPPQQPIMGITFKNFRIKETMIEDLSYEIFGIQYGDFSSAFDDLKNYKLVSHGEFILAMHEASRKFEEQSKDGKVRNQ